MARLPRVYYIPAYVRRRSIATQEIEDLTLRLRHLRERLLQYRPDDHTFTELAEPYVTIRIASARESSFKPSSMCFCVPAHDSHIDKLLALLRLIHKLETFRERLIQLLLKWAALSEFSAHICRSTARYREYHGAGRPPSINQVLGMNLVFL